MPLIEPKVAVTVALPTATPVATPLVAIVATAVEDELQLTVVVRFCVLPSLYVPVAVNAWFSPAGIEAAEGLTVMEVSTGAVTVNAAEPLMLPEAAVMVAAPCEMPLAKPLALIVAMDGSNELHCTVLVRFCVLPLV